MLNRKERARREISIKNERIKETNIMSKIYTSADQLIGKTPLLELTHIEKKYGKRGTAAQARRF